MTKETDMKVSNYPQTLLQIKNRIHQARYQAFSRVNQELIGLYWDIGKIITKKQEKENWGKSVVERLSKDIQIEFPGIRGFSIQNVWYMRQFYLTYKGSKKLQALLGEISWTHHLQIIKCETEKERIYYIENSVKFGWSYRVLQHKIETKTFQKIDNNQTNFDQTLPVPQGGFAKMNVKDDYDFDFLTLSKNHFKKELENKLVNNICDFLKELGGYFAFIDRQYRVTIDDQASWSGHF